MRRRLESRVIKEGRVVRFWHGTKRVMDMMSIRAALAVQGNATVAAGLLATAKKELPPSVPESVPESASLLTETEELPGRAASREVLEKEKRKGVTTARHRKLAAAAERMAKKWKKFVEVTKPTRKETNFKYKWTTEV
ncbi:unnamed protein product [Symbiodinium sp. CCMP2592]|nr:unnamed protein product [Symbiodinium sp. CCMP2592]